MNGFKLFGKVALSLCIISVFVLIFLEPKIEYENYFILLLCNIAFTGIIPITISVLSANAYIKSSNIRFLLMGCGMLIFGLGSITAGITLYLPNSINLCVVIYNSCAFASSVFYLFTSQMQKPLQIRGEKKKYFWLIFSFFMIVLFVAIFSLLVYKSHFPVFFDRQGTTKARDILMWLTVVFFFESAITLYRHNVTSRISHLYWYSLALMTLTVGLLGTNMAHAAGSVLGWTGRICQYLRFIFALVSMIKVISLSRSKGLSTNEFMTNFFADAETKYKRLVESLSSAIVVVDENFRVFYSNTAAQRMFRLSNEEFLNVHFIQSLLPKQYYRPLCDEVRSLINSPNNILAGQNRKLEAIDLAGNVFPVEMSFSLCPLESGYACTFVIQNITEQVNQQMKLVAQAEELHKKNRLMTDFFTNISHEFKTPITLILNLVELIELRIRPVEFTNKEKLMRNLSVMRQNSHRLLRLIANLLDVTKMDAGFMQVSYQMLDIPQWMGKLLQSVEDFAEQHGIKVSYKDESNIQLMPMDGEKLDRIMLNLISNSIKHTRTGGHIDVRLSDIEDNLLISVKDDGEGIPEDKQCLIINRFQQVNSSFNRSSEGSGLGLALTKGLVDLLQGRIWFTSKEGEGTTFFLELPITVSPEANNLPVMGGLTLNRRVEMEFSDIL